MKRIHLLTTAAILLAAVSQPSLAASRAHRADPAQAADQLDQVRRDYYHVYGDPGYNAYARGEVRSNRVVPQDDWNQTYPSQNLPYPDRPWGAPDKD